MKIEKFEDIVCWQKSKEMTVLLYGRYKDSDDFIFRDQILKASMSIMSSIAEGFERHSDRQFLYFLGIANSACGEVRSLNILAEAIGKVDATEAEAINNLCVEISKLINGLIITLSPKNMRS